MTDSVQKKKFERLYDLSQTFTPGTPIKNLGDFSGRWELVSSVYSVLFQPGQHVALFGDRGVGKTSLANILGESFAEKTAKSIRSVRQACSSGDTFTSVWRGIFKKLGISVDDIWTASPSSIIEMLDGLDYRPLLVIDELDRFDDQDGLSLLADTIKAMSDETVRATIVLVGVSDTLEQLIGDHESIGRALVQIKVDRMTERDLSDIVTRGLNRMKMTASEADVRRVARLSEGLPHYTHLLAHSAAERSIQDDRWIMSGEDVDTAIASAVQKAQDTIRNAYAKAIFSPRPDNLFEKVLLACALAHKNEVGYFSPRDVRDPLNEILDRETPIEISAFVRHLNEFTTGPHGQVLQKRGERRKWGYRFSDPMLQPYILLKGIANKSITEQQLAALRPVQPNSFPDGI